MSGTLYVVATPIGNLEDITLRALRVLREASVVVAEDTRRTAKLLSHHSIPARSLSFHAHNARSRVPQLMARLSGGESIALVTDAGTPGVSDPGLELVAAAIEKGIQVDPLPGPSAPLVALVGSGFPLVPFTVWGFPPNKSTARKKWLTEAARARHSFSFFEAPHRIRQTLVDAARVLVERPIVLARELTKMHQEFLRGTAAELIESDFDARGEFTVVVGPAVNANETTVKEVSDSSIRTEFGYLTETMGLPRRNAINQLAKKYQKSARVVFASLERTKICGD